MTQLNSQTSHDEKSLASLFSVAYREFRQDANVTARDLLERYVELSDHKKYAVELIYEEYCRSRETDPDFSPASFLQRYSEYESQLYDVLSVHHEFGRPKYLKKLEQVLWPDVGDVVGEFELVDRLGRGSYSSVFLARQSSVNNREVVLKLTPTGNVELTALSRLESQHIVPVYTASQLDKNGLSAICMPFLGRVTLFHVLQHYREIGPREISASELLARLDLPVASDESTSADTAGQSYEDWVLGIGKQMLRGLAAAHDKGVLHCDVKPSNVLIVDTGTARLIDFNLAQTDGSGYKGGTFPYMAPEQLLGLLGDSDQELNASTDLFGWGATMVQLLSGKVPFDCGSDQSLSQEVEPRVIQAILDRQREGVPAWNVGESRVSSEIEALISSTLNPSIENRPESARQLLTALEACSTVAPIAGGEQAEKKSDVVVIGPWDLTRRQFHAARLAVAMAAILASLALAVPTMMGWLSGSTPNATAPQSNPQAGPYMDVAVHHYIEGDLPAAIMTIVNNSEDNSQPFGVDDLLTLAFLESTNSGLHGNPRVSLSSIGAWHGRLRRMVPNDQCELSDADEAFVNYVFLETSDLLKSDSTNRSSRVHALLYFEAEFERTESIGRLASASHHNQAMLQLAQFDVSRGPTRLEALAQAEQDILVSIEEGPKCPDVYLDHSVIQMLRLVMESPTGEDRNELIRGADANLLKSRGSISSSAFDQLSRLIQQIENAESFQAPALVMEYRTLASTTKRNNTNRIVIPRHIQLVRQRLESTNQFGSLTE